MLMYAAHTSLSIKEGCGTDFDTVATNHGAAGGRRRAVVDIQSGSVAPRYTTVKGEVQEELEEDATILDPGELHPPCPFLSLWLKLREGQFLR